MDAVTALERFGGVARTRNLLKAGVRRNELSDAVAGGTVLRIRQGAYALPGAPAALVRAYECGALLTCVSAAPYYGLWVLRQPGRLHLTETNASGVVVHRVRPKARDAILPVVALPDALCHAALCLPELEALVMIESATASGAVALEFLRRRLTGNRNGAARSVLDLVERGADSPLETVARVLFRRAGIHVEAQAELAGIGIVDFLLEGFLIIEIDGLAFHLEPRRYKKDRARDRRAVAGGYLLMRYHYDDVIHHPERMLAEVRQVLRGRVVRLRPEPAAPTARRASNDGTLSATGGMSGRRRGS